MSTRTRILAAALATLGGTFALAAEPAAPDPPVYRPVTSDIMNAYIQPRHTKLGLAGQAQNWEYAEYERHNIGGALARWEAAVPLYKDLRVADLVAAFATPQLAGLDQAIKSHDPTAFATAYSDLTAGCNQCHAATGHAFVVMKVPGAPASPSNAFPDQDFQPPAP